MDRAASILASAASASFSAMRCASVSFSTMSVILGHVSVDGGGTA